MSRYSGRVMKRRALATVAVAAAAAAMLTGCGQTENGLRQNGIDRARELVTEKADEITETLTFDFDTEARFNEAMGYVVGNLGDLSQEELTAYYRGDTTLVTLIPQGGNGEYIGVVNVRQQGSVGIPPTYKEVHVYSCFDLAIDLDSRTATGWTDTECPAYVEDAVIGEHFDFAEIAPK